MPLVLQGQDLGCCNIERYWDKDPTMSRQLWTRKYIYRYASFLGAYTEEFGFKFQTARNTSPLVIRETEPPVPSVELLDTVTVLGDFNQLEPNELENYDEFSPPSLMNSNADGEECDDKIWQVLRGLNKLVTSLSQKLKTLQILDSYQKSNSLPIIIAGSDPPAVQRALRARQTVNINLESPLRAVSERLLAKGKICKDFNYFL